MQLEDLAESHKKEENRFIESMRILMRVGPPGCSALPPDSAVLLEAERERKQALEMFALFKKQGGEIISELKQALQEACDRCTALEGENTTMKRIISEYPGGKEIGEALRSVASQSRIEELEKRITEYRGLLEEEDAIIQELQHRNKNLETKVETLRLQRDKLLDVDQTKSVSFQQDYNEVMAALHEAPNLHVPQDPLERLALQQKLIQMLTSKLKAEQRERLRIEEQSARLAAEQEKMIRKMNEKQRSREVDRLGVATASPTHQDGAYVVSPTRDRSKEETRPASARVSPAVGRTSNVRSLEAQLAGIAKDLNSSLDMWAAKLSATDSYTSLTEGRVKVPPLPIPSSGLPTDIGPTPPNSTSESSPRYLPESPVGTELRLAQLEQA